MKTDVYLQFKFAIALCIICSISNSIAEKKCDTGYYGYHCDFKECDKSSLEYHQCKNGGICIQHNITSEIIKCKCKAGYSGPLCEKPPCLNHCYNSGKCVLDEKNKMKCLCNKRFTGDKCQFDTCIYQAARCEPSCYMTSSCKCQCGVACDYEYCNKNNGTCFNNNGELGCKCKAGFSGPVCSIDDCKGYCFNGGICKRGINSVSCICPEGFKSDKRCGVQDLKPIKSKQHSEVPTEYRSTRIIMYALSITLFICLVSIGGYISIQRGMFSFLLAPFDNKGSPNSSPSASYTRGTSLPFANSNLNFNKLEEDEESIVNNYSPSI